MIDDLDKQIAATQAELGLVREEPPRFKILHSLFNLSPAKVKFTASVSTTQHQESPEESDNLELDLQMVKVKADLDRVRIRGEHFRLDSQLADVKAELDRVRIEGEHFRYRREQQRQKSQQNLKKKTRTLKMITKQLLGPPDSLTRQIVEQIFNDPFRNRFCLNIEVKNVQVISNMWCMHRQKVLQFGALHDLNELLDIERTNLQEEAHTNRAHMVMLTELDKGRQHRARMSLTLEEIAPKVDNIKLQVEPEYQKAERRDRQRLRLSILNRQELSRAVAVAIE
jgi:hypothetical protein